MKNFFSRQKAATRQTTSDDSAAGPSTTPTAAPPAAARASTQSNDNRRTRSNFVAHPQAMARAPLPTRLPPPASAITRSATHDAQTPDALAQAFSHHKAQTKAGVFHGLNVNFETPGGQPITPTEQAKSILNTAKALIEVGGAPGVAITCSTGTNGTSHVQSIYAKGEWKTDLVAGRQGLVITEMEDLQSKDPTYFGLQGRVCVAPISTVDNNQTPLTQDEFDAVILNDLERINTQYLEKGWVVIGWKNQLTAKDAENPYAVGGGDGKQSDRAIGESQNRLIQDNLRGFSVNFEMLPPPPPTDSAGLGTFSSPNGLAPRKQAPTSATTQSLTREVQTQRNLAHAFLNHRAQNQAGVFHGLNVNFETPDGQPISPTEQAKSILNTAKALIEVGQAPGVAITCSTGTSGTSRVQRRYARGEWKTDLRAGHQGLVITEMEKLQGEDPNYIGLQGKVCVAPISTVDTNKTPLAQNEFKAVIRNDLERIETQYLAKGWVVLGWKNQLTVNDAENPYAVGGGHGKEYAGAIGKSESSMIQDTLIGLSRKFEMEEPTRPAAPPVRSMRPATVASFAGDTGPSNAGGAGDLSKPTLNLRDPTPAQLANMVKSHRAHTDRGLFHGFKLNYADASNRTIHPRAQANSILKMAKALIESGDAPGVAITYSANTGQTRKIRDCYSSNIWNTGTDGSNQAAVIAELEKLQQEPEHKGLLGKLRIAPISTIDANKPPLSRAAFDRVLSDDLARIKSDYLDNGWVVLGWQNQDTADRPDHPYAVGGGIAKSASNAITQKQSNDIQDTLTRFSQEYALNSGSTR